MQSPRLLARRAAAIHIGAVLRLSLVLAATEQLSAPFAIGGLAALRLCGDFYDPEVVAWVREVVLIGCLVFSVFFLWRIELRLMGAIREGKARLRHSVTGLKG